MVQISTYNLHTKQKSIRYLFDEEKGIEIINAQQTLIKETYYRAFEIVLTEIVTK